MASFPDLIFLKQQVIDETFYCFPFYPKNDNNDNKSSTKRHLLRIFSLFKMNILGLFVPFLIMCFCYSQILWRPMSTQTSKKLAIRLVLVVLAVFLCCWVPYNLACFFKALELLDVYTGCENSKVLTLALQITEAVAYSHSCLNPVLYMFVGKKFRRHLVRLINRAPCRLCQFIKVLLPQEDRVTGSVTSQTSSLDERSTAV